MKEYVRTKGELIIYVLEQEQDPGAVQLFQQSCMCSWTFVPKDWQIFNALSLQRTEGDTDLTVFPGLQATRFQNQNFCLMSALPSCRHRISLTKLSWMWTCTLIGDSSHIFSFLSRETSGNPHYPSWGTWDINDISANAQEQQECLQGAGCSLSSQSHVENVSIHRPLNGQWSLWGSIIILENNSPL